MKTLDSQTTLTISEGYDLPTQTHSVRNKCSCCDYFHKECTVKLWKILVFLLIIAVIVAAMAILIAMFGPGNSNLKYSKSEARVENPSKHPVIEGTEPASSTKAPTEGSTSTVEPPCLYTTVTPTSFPTKNKMLIQCDVAIVGGGTAGLLTAYAILKNRNETKVCILEKENRLGGKILDHRFAEVPNVTVGLGEWHIYGGNYDESDLWKEIRNIDDLIEYWNARKVHRVEDRGVYTSNFESLKSQAFPTLQSRTPTNKTIVKTAELVKGDGDSSNYSTSGRFLSSFLSPEGAKWMVDAYGLKGGYMEKINPESYKDYLKTTLDLEEESQRSDDFRPKKGMSELIDKLSLKVQNLSGTIYLQETVSSVSKQGNHFILLTTNFTVQANKTVLTTGPEALKKIKGDVIRDITNHEIFKSIVSVPLFRGAAVYQTAWWNDSFAIQKNNSLQPLQMFASNSNCLGITMPYTSDNGKAVLHTIANNAGCSDNWGNILKISKNAVDKEMKRALEYKFRRPIPEPLDTVYKYWEEGFWFFQKPGANFSLTEIREWAKKPLDRNNVFLVGRAFYQFGGWLQDDIKSTAKALKQGWDITLKLKGKPVEH